MVSCLVPGLKRTRIAPLTYGGLCARAADGSARRLCLAPASLCVGAGNVLDAPAYTMPVKASSAMRECVPLFHARTTGKRTARSVEVCDVCIRRSPFAAEDWLEG